MVVTVTHYGPFSVRGSDIDRIRSADFSQFVNLLLEAEVAAGGMVGTALESTYRDNTPDGGVDAALRRATGSAWIPAGDSAWQFKAGDLPPAKCKKELEGAAYALDILRGGGKYRLVLGDSITSAQTTNRRAALRDMAQGMGIALVDDSIEVIGADALARWVQQFPALAVAPFLGGLGYVGQTFGEWSSSGRHQGEWTPSESRQRAIDGIRHVVESDSQRDVHVDGVSGLGKTRLVMEALRGHAFEPLCLYAPAADQFQASTLAYLQAQERAAVVVVDSCDVRTHEVYASVLTKDTSLRLVTMGEPTGSSTRSAMIGLSGLENEAMTALLRANEPSLWPQAISVIVDVANGNVDYAVKAAKALLTNGDWYAGQLVTDADIRKYISDQLPNGALFLASGVLALFSRVGFDAEAGGELRVIADRLAVPEADLRSAAGDLERHGLLTRQGRFRGVGPQPVALYLASVAWLEFGERIVDELLPALDEDMTERLFRRAADIGDPEVSRRAVDRLMAPDGLLGSWDHLATRGQSRLLVHLAVLAPTALAARLEALIEAATESELVGFQSIRRDLIWAIEKLAWHTRTFEAAADMLLRLALAENEDFSNNATGTWISLFGSMLPGTAASPEMRLGYLADVARAHDPRIRVLFVKAANHALDHYETIMISGERQGGTVVEPRGTPATYEAAWNYRNIVTDLLRTVIAEQPDSQVAEEALKALISAIHPSLEVPTLTNHLAETLSTLGVADLRKVRKEVESLRALFAHAMVSDRRPEALEEFAAQLPPESPDERLWTLTGMKSWDKEDGQLEQDIQEAATALGADQGPKALLNVLAGGECPSAFEIGRVLARLASEPRQYLPDLRQQIEGPNREAIVGYLWQSVEAGDAPAFDEFIDSIETTALRKVELTVRGPVTVAAEGRIGRLIHELSVADGARLLFRWMRDSTADQVADLVEAWRQRMSSQIDYNATIDLLALWLHGRDDGANERLLGTIAALLAERRRFPQLGQQSGDWARLASRTRDRDPAALADLMLDLVEDDALKVYDGSDERAILEAAIENAGPRTWQAAMERVAGGSWRLAFSTRGWLADSADLATARDWVGDDIERARALASVATLGGERLTDVAVFLLTRFGEDKQVRSSLFGEFVSGTWWGSEAERIVRQIEQIRGWMQDRGLAKEVKKWLRELIVSLEASQMRAKQREAEDWY
jgi:hypothetical protein